MRKSAFYRPGAGVQLGIICAKFRRRHCDLFYIMIELLDACKNVGQVLALEGFAGRKGQH